MNYPGELNAAGNEFDDVIPLHEIASCLPLSHEAATEQCSQSCYRGVPLSHEAASAEAILDPFRCGNLPRRGGLPPASALNASHCKLPLSRQMMSLFTRSSGLLGIFCQKGGHNSGRRYCLQITLPLDLRSQAPALLPASCSLDSSEACLPSPA